MRMLYKYPATKKTSSNYMHRDYFDYIIVKEDEAESYLEDDWYFTTTEAKESYTKKESDIENNHPPTREELELKAQQFGIGFNDKTRDNTLLKKINKAIEAQDELD